MTVGESIRALLGPRGPQERDRTPARDEAERLQYAALCYRAQRGKLQILMITSRDTGRWIIPKGWPMPGRQRG
jgi:8-oxo-dGTP pyrophosphatase MutT (NUDIX family)